MLLRLDILENKGGVCLFEKVWKWSGVSRAEGICKLVLTFYQISRDIGDTGEVHQVLFDSPPTVSSPRERGMSGNSTATTGSGGRKSGGKGNGGSGGYHNTTTATRYIGSLKKKQGNKDQQPTIRLASAKNHHIIVAIFHEVNDDLDSVKKLANTFLNKFDELYGTKIKENKKLIDEVAEDEKRTGEVLELFKYFVNDVDPLIEGYLQNTKSHESVNEFNDNNNTNSNDEVDDHKSRDTLLTRV